MRFEYISIRAEKSEVALYCRILDVTPQGYNKYLKSLTRPYKYADLLADIKAVLETDEFNKTYGRIRMFEELQLNYDCPYCYHTVSKVMDENGLMQRRNKTKGLTKADKDAQRSDNLLKRDFKSDEPNKKTVTDITEFAGCDGKVYTSAIFDCFDNACLGLSMADNMRTELVIQTFERAAASYDLTGAISHSDYTEEKTIPKNFGFRYCC